MNNINKYDEYDENYNFEDEFKKLRESLNQKYKTKINKEEKDFDVKYIEDYDNLNFYKRNEICEEEFIERIKNIDKFFFDDYKKIEEHELIELNKEVENKPLFEIVCFYKYDYIKKKGLFVKFVNENENTKKIILRNKFDVQYEYNYNDFYIYGKIKDFSKKDDFRKKMELFLKCNSIVVKKKKNIDKIDMDETIKEINNNDEDDTEELKENKIILNEKINQLKENEEFEEMDERKIEFINSIINKKIK